MEAPNNAARPLFLFEKSMTSSCRGSAHRLSSATQLAKSRGLLMVRFLRRNGDRSAVTSGFSSRPTHTITLPVKVGFPSTVKPVFRTIWKTIDSHLSQKRCIPSFKHTERFTNLVLHGFPSPRSKEHVQMATVDRPCLIGALLHRFKGYTDSITSIQCHKLRLARVSRIGCPIKHNGGVKRKPSSLTLQTSIR